MKKILWLFFTMTLGFIHTEQSMSHEGEVRPAANNHGPRPENASFLSINRAYVQTVKPIFQKSCLDCHSSQTRYPWYAKIPFVKGFIENDIREAKTHLDMTEGFPFKSHASPLEDLNAIAKSMRENSMPPIGYRIAHWNSRLTVDERTKILRWIENSKAKMQ